MSRPSPAPGANASSPSRNKHKQPVLQSSTSSSLQSHFCQGGHAHVRADPLPLLLMLPPRPHLHLTCLYVSSPWRTHQKHHSKRSSGVVAGVNVHTLITTTPLPTCPELQRGYYHCARAQDPNHHAGGIHAHMHLSTLLTISPVLEGGGIRREKR